MFNLFYKIEKETQMVSIKYVDENKVVEKEFELSGDFNENRIEELEEFLGNDIEDIIRLSFYKLVTKTNGKKTIQVEGAKRSYFFGERISLSDYQNMLELKNPYDQVVGLDDYIISAVLHPNTQIVSPLYSGDKILEGKKTKTR